MSSSTFRRSTQDIFDGLGLAADSHAPLQGRGGQARGWDEALGVDLGLEGQQAAQKLFLDKNVK
jgi:hypothetical protein